MVSTVLIAGLSISAVAASRNITVTDGFRVVLDGQTFQPKDGNGAPVELFSYNGTIYAPMRAICEAAGMEVTYDTSTKTATLTSPGNGSSTTTTTTTAPSEPAQSTTVQPGGGTLIDESVAKANVLKHAGISADKATFTKVKLERGIGSTRYELEFYDDTTEYDYEVDAQTGNILKFEQESRDKFVTTRTTNGQITSLRAKEIALKRAPSTAIVTSCELDEDDNVYELKLRHGLTKYECEIDAKTGDVLKWEEDD